MSPKKSLRTTTPGPSHLKVSAIPRQQASSAEPSRFPHTPPKTSLPPQHSPKSIQSSSNLPFRYGTTGSTPRAPVSPQSSSSPRTPCLEQHKLQQQKYPRKLRSEPPNFPRRVSRLSTFSPGSTISSSSSGRNPPSSIWSSSTSSSRISNSWDLMNDPGINYTVYKRSERLVGLAKLSVKPLPQVLYALANKKVPGGSRTSLGETLFRAAVKKWGF